MQKHVPIKSRAQYSSPPSIEREEEEKKQNNSSRQVHLYK